jgi:serine phosphatase RsbU (regulator of sigma subunit)
MAAELAPRGPFASATVAVVEAGQVRVLDHVGSAPLQGLNSRASTQLLLQAARTSSLVTDRVVSGGVQKLGYLLSARGRQGVYVVGASQQLPASRRITVPAGSPDANLNFVLYFGRSASPGAVIETNVARLPLTGTVSRATVPFGNNVLTLVASPRGSLAGTWAEYLPWGIFGLGIVLSVAAAIVGENLVRRRATAESLYTQQRRVSEVLQRSLLPRKLPEVPRWEFAARYVPATTGAEIGGDWYSVVEVDDHRFAVVVGDVSGHDIAAAGVMADLRYTIRTLARLGIPPGEILDRTNTELDVTGDAHFATVLVGVVDTGLQELTLASAGHPPPLMVHQGRAEFLDVSPGPPLGVRSGPRPTPITIDFPPGSTLVAFTDGLIEKRGQSLDAGLAQLAAAAAESPARPDDLIGRLLAELATNDQEDDIAVVAIQFTGQEANPAALDPSHSTSPTVSRPL